MNQSNEMDETGAQYSGFSSDRINLSPFTKDFHGEKLEPIIQSEVSQKDKDHYNILTHIYGI